MSFISSMFGRHKKTSAVLYVITNTVTNGQITGKTETNTATIDGLFWEGSPFRTTRNEKIEQRVDATFVYDYVAYSTALPVASKLVINSTNYYVILSENLGAQDNVILVYLESKK